MKLKPRCVVRRSAFLSLNIWLVLFFWLIIPLIIQIGIIIVRKISYVVKFYDDRIITVKGIFSKYEKQTVFMGVYAVRMQRSFWGRIFNYGDVIVDAPGEWDVPAKGIASPKKLKKYLETRIISGGTANVVYN